MLDDALDTLVVGAPVVLALLLHELAHGLAALLLGDDTARRMGRLSLNPLRHVDRVGTVLLPGALLLGQWLVFGRVVFVFGWAKPVPVAAYRFRDPRRGMALVAAAGPLANFTLAWLAALAFHAVAAIPDSIGTWPGDMLAAFIQANLVLGLFNLLPIPPLDGGRIAVGILPARWAAVWARLERVGLVLVIGLLVLLPQALQAAGVRFDPVEVMLGTVLPRAVHLLSRLAFLHVG